MEKDIYLLGASGSIGTQTLDIIKEFNIKKLKGISVGRNIDIAKKIIVEFNIEIVCVQDKIDYDNLKVEFPNTNFCYGDEGLIYLAEYGKGGILINALMGSVGLLPTIHAIKSGKDIALANKETLVMAGDIIIPLVKEYNVELLPIDSEHSAIWQCLKGEDINTVRKLIITASGGSFRNKTRDELKNVTLEDALKHPNWSMGKKITIDSATMMNKGLEVIEAHHLFQIPYDKIETVIHKESVIHSMVEFNDRVIKAQLGTPDMRIPILYALSYGKRKDCINHKSLELTDMNFEKMNFDRFPMLELAYKAGKMGGIAPTILNAANEAAVSLFLNKKISFLDIETIVIKELNNFKNFIPNVEDIISIDKEIKRRLLNEYCN